MAVVSPDGWGAAAEVGDAARSSARPARGPALAVVRPPPAPGVSYGCPARQGRLRRPSAGSGQTLDPLAIRTGSQLSGAGRAVWRLPYRGGYRPSHGTVVWSARAYGPRSLARRSAGEDAGELVRLGLAAVTPAQVGTRAGQLRPDGQAAAETFGHGVLHVVRVGEGRRSGWEWARCPSCPPRRWRVRVPRSHPRLAAHG